MKLLTAVTAPYPGGLSLAARAAGALKLLVEDVDLPVDVGAALAGFIEDATAERLYHLQRSVAAARLWEMGGPEVVNLVARLASDRQMTMQDAARVLASVPHNMDGLSSAQSDLVDVAGHVCEDAREGFMEVDDDDIFRHAIQQVIAEREHE